MKLLAGYELTGYLKLQHNIRAQFIEFDELYAPVSKRFILGKFSEEYVRELDRKRKRIAHLQSNDCENFAMRAMLLAQDLHDSTNQGQSSVAFGMVNYWIDADINKKHWINFGANWKDTTPLVLNAFFWEPQTRREVFLSQQELNTCEYGLV